MTTIYCKRENAFESGEHVWRVEADCLIWIRPGGDSLTLLWKDIGAVRAAFAPTRWKAWRHVFEVTTRRGVGLLIDNGHFRGPGDFEDRSATFTPFVLACIDRVITHAPEARAALGADPAGYAVRIVFLLATMILLVWALLALPVLPGWLVIIKLLLIAALLPPAFGWAVRSRPRRIPLSIESLRAGLPRAAERRR